MHINVSMRGSLLIVAFLIFDTAFGSASEIKLTEEDLLCPPEWKFLKTENICILVIRMQQTYALHQYYCRVVTLFVARHATLSEHGLSTDLWDLARTNETTTYFLNSIDTPKVSSDKNSTDAETPLEMCEVLVVNASTSTNMCCHVESYSCDTVHGAICEIPDADACRSNNGGCAQVCSSTGLGEWVCKCFDGYIFDENKSCVDLNECKVNNGFCQHMCENTIGSRNCHCYPGYRVKDNTQCLPITVRETADNDDEIMRGDHSDNERPGDDSLNSTKKKEREAALQENEQENEQEKYRFVNTTLFVSVGVIFVVIFAAAVSNRVREKRLKHSFLTRKRKTSHAHLPEDPPSNTNSIITVSSSTTTSSGRIHANDAASHLGDNTPEVSSNRPEEEEEDEEEKDKEEKQMSSVDG